VTGHVPEGVLGADSSIAIFDPRLSTAFAMTEEEAGGVVGSISDAVVAGTVI
jgi:hypothetical protein